MKQLMKTLVVAMLGGVVSLGIYTGITDNSTTVSTPVAEPTFTFTNYGTSPSVPLESIDFVEAAARSVNAVVHVKTVFQTRQYYNPWSRYFGGQPYSSREQRGSGSGVIISDNGYIVTNNHVIDNAERIEVVTNDNRIFAAELIGSDPGTDLALLKVDATDLPSIILGDSDNLQVGEWVLAVGNPFNLTSTVTAGIVSAKARNINILDYNPDTDEFPLESFIQTDAAVNPGNSGGALVNGRGELVGINTAIASRTGSYSGYSFAIPVSIVQKVTADLLEFGAVQRAYIGVNISDITGVVKEELGLSVSQGALVRGLLNGGAAADAGLKEGDVITGVEGITVGNVTQLQEQVGKYRPGDKISVDILRDGRKKSFTLVLRDRHGGTEPGNNVRSSTVSSESVFGARLESLTPDEKRKLNVANGVKITELTNGKFKSAGITKGFVITRIDKQPVDSPEDVERILRNKTGGVLVEGYHPNGTPDYYGFGV